MTSVVSTLACPETEPDFLLCTDCIGSNLRKAMRAVGQYYDEALRPTGIRGTQFSLLVATKMAGSVTLTRLAEVTVMDRTTLTRNLNVLEKQWLVTVTAGADRRTRNIAITKQGIAVLRQAYPLWHTAQKRLMTELGTEGLQALMENTAKLLDAVKSD